MGMAAIILGEVKKITEYNSTLNVMDINEMF